MLLHIVAEIKINLTDLQKNVVKIKPLDYHLFTLSVPFWMLFRLNNTRLN